MLKHYAIAAMAKLTELLGEDILPLVLDDEELKALKEAQAICAALVEMEHEVLND